MSRDPLGNSASLDRLRILYRDEVSIPARVDETIRIAAATHFASFGRSRRVPTRGRWRLVASIAIAAFVAMAVRRGPAAGPEDVDRNGVVNILDAWALERRLQVDASSADLDLNGDGRADRADVRIVALRAVDLGDDGTDGGDPG